MKVSLQALKSLLEQNVVELKFLRRRPRPGQGLTRRMLCTNSNVLLESANGVNVLNYNRPTTAPKYNPTSKNLVITWDIFRQDFRAISVNDCDVITVTPADESNF